MWLMEVVNAKKQRSVSKKFCFKYTISMIKAKLSFSEQQIQKVMVLMVTRVLFCSKSFKNFSDSSQMMLKLGRNIRWVEVL